MSEFLTLPGAVAASLLVDAADDAPTHVLHYGDPMREQRLLAAGEAIVELSDRRVVSVTGPDRLTWLDSMGTQSLAQLAPGESAETMFLDAQGRINFVVHAVDDGETLWLITEEHVTDGLVEWLSSMRFMLRVEVALSELRVFGTLGAPPIPTANRNGISLVWHDPWAGVTAGGHQYALVSEHPGSAWTWSEHLVEPVEVAGMLASVTSGELAVAGQLAVTALRIAAWRPQQSSEVDDRTIPHELDWLRTAIHLTKGCFRGQETVAKVHNLGHPPRRLVMLHLDGSDGSLPEPGAEVFADPEAVKPLGVVTSSARHYELGPIALAVIKRTTATDATLAVGEERVAANQEVVVPPTAGATANVPRLRRLG